MLVQLLDIALHIATNQVEPLRVTSNLVILGWLAFAGFRQAPSFGSTPALFVVLGYLGLNILFLPREGFTNPNQGGGIRYPLFCLVGLTVILSAVFSIRRKLN